MALHPESLPCFSLLQEERYVSDSFMYCILWLDCQRNHMRMFPGFLCFSSPRSAVSGKPNKRAAGCRRRGRPHGRPREVPPWPRIQR